MRVKMMSRSLWLPELRFFIKTGSFSALSHNTVKCDKGILNYNLINIFILTLLTYITIPKLKQSTRRIKINIRLKNICNNEILINKYLLILKNIHSRKITKLQN